MSLPFISVVIPTHGRPEGLRNCLTALTHLDYPRDAFEVVVVDDGSAVTLDEVVAPFRWPLDVRLLRQHRGGPGSARNTGLATARGEFVAFTADDCIPAADWLQRLAARFVQCRGSAVGGRIVNALPDNPFSASTDLLIRYLYDYYNRPPQEAQFFTPNNLAFPVHQLRALGGFVPSFVTGEDRELCERWRAAGNAMLYAPEVVVTHEHPLDLIGFCSLHFRYGQGSSRFRHCSANRQSCPVRFEPFSFYVNLVSYPFTQIGAARAMLLSGLLGVAQVANATGFFYQSLTGLPDRQQNSTQS
jgi:GT2 family glycosyltransferase